MSLYKFILMTLGLGALLLMGATAVPAAHAAGIVVNDNADTIGPCSTGGTGTCTLRDAITYATATSGADTIIFAADYAITLTAELPTITDSLSIDGTGRTITVDGAGNSKILTVNENLSLNLTALTLTNAKCDWQTGGGGAVTNWGVLNVTGVTFSNNDSTYCGKGGAIHNQANATLNVTNSTFTDNTASAGGAGIFNVGTATINHSTFTKNKAGGFGLGTGGGIMNFNSASLTVQNSTFTGNFAGRKGGGIDNRGSASVIGVKFLSNVAGGDSFGNGGGLHNGGGGTTVVNNATFSANTGKYGAGAYNGSGTLKLKNSTFTGNKTVTVGNGGGILNNGGTTTVNNTTISAGWAEYGGGIYVDGGTVTVTNSTVTGNTGWARGGGMYNYTGTLNVANSTVTTNWTPLGGGLYNDSGTLTVTNSTVSGNKGWNQGGGIYNDGTATTLYNTIVSGNSNHDCDDYSNTMTANSHNLDSDGSCAGATTSAVGQIALGPLQDNGGPTQTLALGAGSSALDAGDNAVCAAAPVNGWDQRGVARPQGTACDVGAFESNTQFGPLFVVNDTADTEDGVCDALLPGGYNCTLREAINAANARNGADTITFSIPANTGGCTAANHCVLNLSSMLPALATKLTIDGAPNDGRITLYAATANPIMTVNTGKTLNVNALTLVNGGDCFQCINEGGIFNNGTLNVTNSTFTGNTATANAGSGISNFGTATVTNSTFSAVPVAVRFTGIYNGENGILNVTNSTIASNGNYGIYSIGGTTTLRNTLVVNNTNGDCQWPGSTLTADTRNIDSDGSCDKATQKTASELALGILQDNGGPTDTIKPGGTSAALDFGRNTVCEANVGAPDYGAGKQDQRGVTRPQGPRCDVGSYEVKGKGE